MRMKWRTPFNDTRTPTTPEERSQQLTSAAINEQNRVFYRDSSQPPPGRRPIAELRADRFRIETADGVHRIFDMSFDQPDPVAEALFSVAEQDRERLQRDRATVADADISMPQRLAALARLQQREQR